MTIVWVRPRFAALAPTICTLLFGVQISNSAVLSVSPDGLTPYPTVQSALDAAAPGDTVQLMPAVHNTYFERAAGGGTRWIAGFIERDVVIIGQPGAYVLGRGYQHSWAFWVESATSVEIRGVYVQEGYGGVFTRCATTVAESTFDRLTESALAFGAESELTLEHCEFQRIGITGVRVDFGRADVSSCSFTPDPEQRAGTAMTSHYGGSLAARDCHTIGTPLFGAAEGAHLEAQDSSAIGTSGGGYAIDSGTTVVLRAVTIRGRNGPGEWSLGIYATRGAHVQLDSTRVQGCTVGLQGIVGARFTVSHSSVVGWQQFAIQLLDYTYPPMATSDMRGNYWGVTDSSAVAAAIWDVADDPGNVPYGHVLFWPVLQHSVPIGESSWGALKRPFGPGRR